MKKIVILAALALSVFAQAETTFTGAPKPKRQMSPVILAQGAAASEPSIADQCEMVYHLSKEATYIRAGGGQIGDLLEEFNYHATHDPSLANYRDSMVLIAKLVWGTPLADLDHPTAVALNVQHDCLANPEKWLLKTE
jgi:hypothetical protein